MGCLIEQQVSPLIRKEMVQLSLAGRRLPELHLVSFRIHDPGKLPILRFVDVPEHIAAFFLQSPHQGVEVFHRVVDHEGSRARRVMIALLWIDQPGSGAGNRVARGVGPIEGGATPFLDIDSEVWLVAGL